SSHSTIVLRGGGIIFSLSMIAWAVMMVVQGNDVTPYIPFLVGLFMVGLILVCGVSFIDDIRSLPDSVRLVAQFVAMILMFYQLDMLHADLWWAVIIALIVCVGVSNIINFMDGINGITGAYAMASLIPLYLINSANGLSAQGVSGFVDESLIITVMLADLVFCYFNFRPRGKAKCFAGDVGSLVVAFILLFMISGLVMATGDVTYLIFLLVYGVDGVLTIFHRIMLHENLVQAHRKHVFQLMANELKMSHITVSLIYAGLQLAISLGFIYLCPNTIVAHWIYLVVAGLVLVVAYVLFMRKYYYLHEQYLKSLEK
ncbi:MAG: hypothetical protein IIU45_04250, partial [Lachnospiraceae bacterium]|nr:hypothetical protein [Lachnospiraceae bacterium]